MFDGYKMLGNQRFTTTIFFYYMTKLTFIFLENKWWRKANNVSDLEMIFFFSILYFPMFIQMKMCVFPYTVKRRVYMPLQGQSYFMAPTHNNITIKAFPFQMKTMLHSVLNYIAKKKKKREANRVKSNIAKENVKNGRINIKIWVILGV